VGGKWLACWVVAFKWLVVVSRVEDMWLLILFFFGMVGIVGFRDAMRKQYGMYGLKVEIVVVVCM
jgi:hypothetical protein